MTSPAKIRANRRNAARSTGPRTRAGKAAVARNALRHGLSLAVLVGDPSRRGDVAELGRRIVVSVRAAHLGIPADVPLDPVVLERACDVAEAQIDLCRVRVAKHPLSEAIEADLCNAAGPLKALARLDRYETRVLSRRKRAVRAFDAALIASASVGRTKPTEKAP